MYQPEICLAEYGSLVPLAQAELLRSKRRASIAWKATGNIPAWEILLQLFIARCKGRDLWAVEVSRLTDFSSDLTLRYLQIMEQGGSVECHQRGTAKNFAVNITERAFNDVASYFKESH